MLQWIPAAKADAPLRVLCLGAHCDDIEIGCGGALISMAEERPGTQFHCAVLSATNERERETRAALGRLLRAAGDPVVEVERFRNSYFPFTGAEIKDWFEALKDRFSPDLIFTHYHADAHQDHRTVSELTWNTFRDHSILEYEIPKYDGDIGRPNAYLSLSESIVQRKIDCIVDSFASQHGRHWFSADAFRSILRIRGIECAAPSGYAEAFFARKLLVRF